MSWYNRPPAPPKIEVGREFVVVREKYSDKLARILRDETDKHGVRRLTLDRRLDRYPRKYTEFTDDGQRTWHGDGAFVTVLTLG
jgi:hypothetical protein